MILSYLTEDYPSSCHHQQMSRRPTHSVHIIDTLFIQHGGSEHHICDIRVICIAAFDLSQLEIVFKKVDFAYNHFPLGPSSTGSCIHATASYQDKCT